VNGVGAFCDNSPRMESLEMPIYEYQCESCKHELEKIQKFSDAPLLDCPDCGAPSLRRKISAPAFRLKGGGWYETDFKSGGKKNLADSSAGASDSAKSSDSGGAAKSGSTAESATKPSAPASSGTSSGAAAGA
jgi:putative FmdB family regulatory protein